MNPTPRRARIRGHRRGGNAIEFALVLPALLALLFGVFEYSWYFNRYLVVSAAARDGARRAAMATEDDDPQAIAEGMVLDYLTQLDDPTDVQVQTEVAGDSPNRTLTVRVTRPYTPIAGSYVPAPDTIAVSFSLRMEDQL
ncbi:MAG: TadE/TadG family type IV pilus assembly protein [Myxococcota bacterium]